MLNRIYGLVLFFVGIGFILLGAYLLYTGGLLKWENMLVVGGTCLFGYLLATAGYRMSSGERF